MKTITLLGLIFFLLGCFEGESSQRERNHLNLPEEGFTFKLAQRSRLEIPSDSNTFFCKISDITKGQTMLQLTNKADIVLVKSVRNGMITDFEFNDKYYKLECDKLINKGLGEDYGYFRLVRDSENYREVKDESADIEQLIQTVAKADIIFVRNGEEHTGQDAADHLRKKWDYADGQVKTVDSFIDNLASKSSMSGKAYKVKLKNGKVLNADVWFRSLLK